MKTKTNGKSVKVDEQTYNLLLLMSVRSGVAVTQIIHNAISSAAHFFLLGAAAATGRAGRGTGRMFD
jgi:hypothetical protein